MAARQSPVRAADGQSFDNLVFGISTPTLALEARDNMGRPSAPLAPFLLAADTAAANVLRRFIHNLTQRARSISTMRADG